MTKGVLRTLFSFAIPSDLTRFCIAADHHFRKQHEIYPESLTPATPDRTQNAFSP